MKKRAFTLVELIVVITILAILATIGFVSFSGYLAGARDTNRVAQLKAMSDALELYSTKKSLPIPDDKVDIKAGTKTIAYQGYIGKNVLETIEYTESGLDPKDKQYFSYYLTRNKKYFQLLAFLEEESEDVLALNVGVPLMGPLNATDYTERFPYTKGKKLGILTDADKTPIQDISIVIGSGYIDVTTTEEVFISHISTEQKVTGTGIILKPLGLSLLNGKEYKSCKEIRENEDLSINSDDTYYIRPEGYPLFEVHCDMTDDGGGWTRYVEIKGNYSFQDAVDCVDRLEKVNNDKLYCFFPYKMGKFTEFKYIDKSIAGQADLQQIYKTVVDKVFNDSDNRYKGIHNTTMFDYMYKIDEPNKKYIWFGLSFKHNHSQCQSDRNPGGMSKITGFYMNYDRYTTIAANCSGPVSTGKDREINAREGEFYVR